jgi:hypothetical protein
MEEIAMIAQREMLLPRRRNLPSPAEIRASVAAIRRSWTPHERVLRQYVADLRRQSLLRAAAKSAA